ncbi:hypothetical protein FHX57_006785 [Paraburkholderia tropica]|uniref:hypothetical protein n=1 Tax=Paraburkholderia tropica TaxID=92647 RepID=UPI001615BB37|nr:hypothetical protein [Paraburkholderia tropica]MBB3004403.1 hypothetical protein [Paraburkholderia tropica]
MNANAPLHVHPLIGEVFELLHRMELCQSEPFVWMARDAINKLRSYEEQVRNKQVTEGK